MDRLKEIMDCVNSSGKCGLADINKLQEDGFYQQKSLGELGYWDKIVEYVHLYKSIVFVKKYKNEF